MEIKYPTNMPITKEAQIPAVTKFEIPFNY